MGNNESKLKIFISNLFEVIEEVISLLIVAGILIFSAYLEYSDSQDTLDPIYLKWTILAIITLIAISNLRDRLIRFRRIEEYSKVTYEKLDETIFDPIRADNFFNPIDKSNSEIFIEAKEIFITGISLNKTIGKFHEAIKQSIIDGAKVKIIILDNECEDSINQLELRSWGKIEPEYYQNRIRTTYSQIKVIGDNLKNTPNVKGKLEVGHLPFVPSFGVIMIDPGKIHGKAFIEFYHHLTDDSGPKFEINLGRDPYWFKFFHKQTRKMWKNCRVDTIC